MTDVVAVVGDPPGAGCGMGDFVGVMNAEYERRGISTGLVLTTHLHLGDFARINRELEALQPKIVHFQFPSISLGRDPIVSLLPRAYRKAPWIITLCEFSNLNPLRQLSLAAMPYTFDGYIFTSEGELSHVARLGGALRKRSVIIPAVSNIQVVKTAAPLPEAERMRRVIYFGQIVPKRGIEDFLEAARLAKAAASDLHFVLVGATPEWAHAYWTETLARAATLGIEVHLNASEEDASHHLQSAAFAYFPYPDGAALKRGTLPAALAHELFLVTRWAEKTEPEVRICTAQAQTPAAALSAIAALRADPAARARLKAGVDGYNESLSFSAITELYLDFYGRFGFHAQPATLESAP